MAKIKVHELAKELELQSKDILSFLQEKGIEAKAAQSSLEEDAAALVRNSLGKKKAAAPAAQKAPVNTENAKPAEEKAQAPAGEAKAQETKVSEETKSTEETKKKKKIIFVSNPQNSKMPGQRQGGQSGQGQRNAGGQRPNQGGRYQNNGYQNNSYGNRVQAQAPVRPIKPLTPPSPTPSVAMVPGNRGQQPAKKPQTQAPVKEQAVQNTAAAQAPQAAQPAQNVAQTRPADRPQNGNRDNRDNRQGGYGQQRGGYGQQGGYRQRTADYDPNAKYSMKKRIEYKDEHLDPNEPIRLNKYLANAGVCSRREADEFIQAGVVTVNGNVVTELGTKVVRTDEVKFHDQPVTLEKKVYVLLNKPKDYVTTSDDPQQRKTVMDLVKNVCPERIYPVGRLDRNTTGVLLLTNDGDLASKLTHPKFLKKKVYHVYLDKNVTAHDMQQIATGIELEDGEIHADDIQYASDTDKSQVGIEIHSGKNRIVRRIFESLGYRVVKLDRVQFAGLTKKNLRRGDWRFLTEKEVEMLRMGAFE